LGTRPAFDPRIGLGLFEPAYQWNYKQGRYTLTLKFEREGWLYDWSYFILDASDLEMRKLRSCTGPH